MKDSLKHKYEIAVIALALVSVGLAIIDLIHGLSPTWLLVDTCIYWIFFGDYFFRLLHSRDKKEFVKNNVFDLVAIVPFNSALRVFRSFRILKASKLTKLTKLSKFARAGSVGARGWKKAKRFFDTNGLKYVILVTVIAIFAGAVGICLAEDMSFTDGLWWAFVTATTVGYGDLSPVTDVGRIIAALLMLVGIGLIGSLTSSITSFFLHEKTADSTPSTDKVEMVKTMFETLSDEEKEMFKNLIQ